MSELDVTRDNLEHMMSTALRRLPPAGLFPPDDEGDLTNLAFSYRLRAIAEFLSRGDVAAYVADLHRSGQARLYYLRGCAAGKTGSPAFFRTSRNRAFFDTIAINDLATAESLADLCDGRFVEDLEYEDDYLFPQFLQVFFLALRGRRDAAGCAAVLGRFAEVVQGEDDPFLGICDALQRREVRAFESSLVAAMDRCARNYAIAADRRDLSPIFLSTERFVDVQAIGVVRIAHEAGMKLARQEYPRVPHELIAQSRRLHAYPPVDSWRNPP